MTPDIDIQILVTGQFSERSTEILKKCLQFEYPKLSRFHALTNFLRKMQFSRKENWLPLTIMKSIK